MSLPVASRRVFFGERSTAASSPVTTSDARHLNLRQRAFVRASTMLFCASSSSRKTHYDVLSVKQDASYDEIRMGYKAAILNSHPDKLHPNAAPLKDKDTFIDVQKAWEVLSDSRSRANYDKELRASRHVVEIADDDIRLDEMSVEDFGDSKEFFYQCRCGDYFSVSGADLEKMGIFLVGNGGVIGSHSATGIEPASILLPCGSCSLKIRLIIDVNC